MFYDLFYCTESTRLYCQGLNLLSGINWINTIVGYKNNCHEITTIHLDIDYAYCLLIQHYGWAIDNYNIYCRWSIDYYLKIRTNYLKFLIKLKPIYYIIWLCMRVIFEVNQSCRIVGSCPQQSIIQGLYYRSASYIYSKVGKMICRCVL